MPTLQLVDAKANELILSQPLSAHEKLQTLDSNLISHVLVMVVSFSPPSVFQFAPVSSLF